MKQFENNDIPAYQKHYLDLERLTREISALLDRAYDLGLTRSARALDDALISIVAEGNEIAASKFVDADEPDPR
jgi:hypothetical protein